MSVSVTFNGTVHTIPSNRQPPGWGAALTLFLQDVGNNALSKAGGTFVLTADIDYGANFGIKAIYLKSRAASISSVGVIRLGNTEVIGWRNNGDDGDLSLSTSASDRLTFGGVNLPTISSTDTFTNKSLSDSTTAIVDEGDATKTLAFQLSGATTSTTTTITASQTASRVVTLPDATTTLVGTNTTDTLTNKTLTSPVINTSVSGTAILDEDDMSSDSDTQLATQQSIKAYVDEKVTGPGSSTDNAAARFDSTTGKIVQNSGVIIDDSNNVSGVAQFSAASYAGTGFKDEDDLSSDSATAVASQQSIKAYVDNEISSLSSSGAQYQAKSASYTITDVDNARTIGVTTGSSDYTITLPTAADNTHRIITIKKVDSGTGTVIVDGEGSETIDGSTTKTIYFENETLTVQCDGSNWESLNSQLRRRTNIVDNSVLSLSGPAGLSVSGAQAFAYRDSAGNYNLNFNCQITFTSASSVNLTYSGVTFASYPSAVTVMSGVDSTIGYGATFASASNHSIVFSVAKTAAFISGDVPLDSKPSWFDANIEDS